MRRITLLELDKELQAKGGFTDLFDCALGDIIDTETMTGSFADIEGNKVIEFNVIEMNEDTTEIIIEVV